MSMAVRIAQGTVMVTCFGPTNLSVCAEEFQKRHNNTSYCARRKCGSGNMPRQILCQSSDGFPDCPHIGPSEWGKVPQPCAAVDDQRRNSKRTVAERPKFGVELSVIAVNRLEAKLFYFIAGIKSCYTDSCLPFSFDASSMIVFKLCVSNHKNRIIKSTGISESLLLCFDPIFKLEERQHKHTMLECPVLPSRIFLRAGSTYDSFQSCRRGPH